MDDGRPADPRVAAPVSDAGRGGVGDAIERAVEGVPGAMSLAPGSVAPALGGELLPEPVPVGGVDGPPAAVAGVGSSGSIRRSLLQASPLAVAGVATNAANVVVTILLARLLTTRGYGALNQLNGLFLVVSMPGSAVIVAVVRRVTAWVEAAGQSRVRRWARRVHRWGVVAVAVFAAGVGVAGPWLARVLAQPGTVGLDAMVVAGAVWVLLCLDRGLLQAHRSYRTLSANLLVEGSLRAAAVLVLVGAGRGVAGAACGILAAEVVTAVHARVTADRAWAPVGDPVPTAGGPAAGATGAAPAERRTLVLDLAVALVALATVAWLQNVDVIVIGREAPGAAGAYAAVSVASKALVFGAIVLGGYLLPEAAIRWRQGGHALRELGVTLLFLAAGASLLLALAVGAPQLLLRLVFTARYLGAEAAFASLVVAMACLSVTVVLTMYLLAVGRRRVAAFLVVGAAGATASVMAAHGATLGTAHADLLVQAVLAGAILVDFASAHRRRLR